MARTLAQRQLAQTRAELERDLKRKDRVRLRKLRESLGEAKRARTQRVRSVYATCKAERERLKVRAREARQRLRDSIQRMRTRAREICNTQLTDTREETGKAIAEAVKQLQEEQRYQGSLRIWSRPAFCPTSGRQRAKERKQESDCEVAANIEDDGLRSVWEKVKHKIKASPRATRTEVFLQWVHDNSADVARIQWEAEEKAIAELERQEHELRKQLAKPNRYRKKSAAELAELLRDVPF